MKDEEMAEEIVKRNVCEDCNRCQSHGYIGCDIYRYSKDGFLAGLKAGRPQWHNYPEKLPEDYTKVLTVAKNKDGDFLYHTFTFGTKESVNYAKKFNKSASIAFVEWSETRYYDVIAWCEIPTFDKE